MVFFIKKNENQKENLWARPAVNSALTVWLEAAAAVLRNWKRQLPIRRWLKTWKQLTPGGNRLRCRQPLQSSAVGKSAAGAVAAGKGRCNH